LTDTRSVDRGGLREKHLEIDVERRS